jgi:short-subunit dehydrogenase/uncharacterized protein (DUF2062 family)
MKIKEVKQAIFSLKGSPAYISKGIALGTFIGMTPLPGFQVLIALTLAKLTRCNAKAATVAVFNSNAFTGIFIFAFNYYIGKKILGYEALPEFPTTDFSAATHFIFYSGLKVFSALLVGGTVVGIPLSILLYKLSLHYFTHKEMQQKSKVLSNQNNLNYTLITGANGGLGKALAVECAKRNHHLILVGLADDQLSAWGKELQQLYAINVLSFEVDFTNYSELDKLIDHLSKTYNINVLINNAGIGGSKKFDRATKNYLTAIIDVNIRATTLITRGLLPTLKKQQQSYILNVGSIAALSPLAYKTIYPASKAFIYSFSRGLKAELAHEKIGVSVLLPGAMMTNEEICNRINKQGSFIKRSVLEVDVIAKRAIDGMYNKKSTIIPGGINRLNAFLFSLLPTELNLSLSTKIVKRELQK